MIYKAIGLFFLTFVKFALTIPIIRYQFDILPSLIITISGGIAGVLFFCFFWRYILDWWNNNIRLKSKKPLSSLKVNKKRRKIIQLKNQYGYWGMVSRTPVFFSIPLGTFLIQRYFKYKKGKLFHLFMSIIFWAFIIILFLSIFKK